MKRPGTVLTALTLAGTLTLATLPVAGAQETQSPATSPSTSASSTSDPSSPSTEPDAPQSPSSSASSTDPASPQTERYTAADGQVYYRTTDGLHWVSAPERVGEELTAEELATSEEIAQAIAGDRTQREISRIAGVALPATLIIAGVTYYLNKDGNTYVEDPARVEADPTVEEIAASDAMLAANAGEVTTQARAALTGGQAATTTTAAAAPAPAPTPAAASRGIAAETGSNTAARLLAGLVVLAAVAGLALVAFRRFAR